MASGKKPRARRDVLRSCPHSGHRAAAARCPRALKPRTRKSAALHAEFPHPYCASGPADRVSIRGPGFTSPLLFAGATPLLPGRGSAPARAGGIARPRVSSGQMSGCRWLITGLTCAGPVRPVTPPARPPQGRQGRERHLEQPCLPAVLTGALSPAFPVVKTGAAVRFSLRFYAGMVRREANGARCEPAVGDARSAQAQRTAGQAGCQHPGNTRALHSDRRSVPRRNIPYRNRSPAGNCRPASCHRDGHRQVPVPGQFSPCFFPEFPEKSGRDRLAAYCPHSQPHSRFCPLQIWSGFMPCYQQVGNRCFRQRRFTRADTPPDTREVSAGVFHHPFRVFRLA